MYRTGTLLALSPPVRRWFEATSTVRHRARGGRRPCMMKNVMLIPGLWPFVCCTWLHLISGLQAIDQGVFRVYFRLARCHLGLANPSLAAHPSASQASSSKPCSACGAIVPNNLVALVCRLFVRGKIIDTAGPRSSVDFWPVDNSKIWLRTPRPRAMLRVPRIKSRRRQQGKQQRRYPGLGRSLKKGT